LSHFCHVEVNKSSCPYKSRKALFHVPPGIVPATRRKNVEFKPPPTVCGDDRTKTKMKKLQLLILGLSVAVMLMAGGSVAMAQQTSAQFASGLSTPQGGLVLSGTASNPATGDPFRHLWTADAVNGLCRLDPDVDTVGLHALNPATCLNTAAGVAFNAAQLTFDPATNTIYAVDGGSKVGVFILRFLPDGDSGHGLMDQANQSILAATGTGASVTSGCGIAIPQPTATSLGPDGNLYVGFKRNGDIMRILSPLTNPLPCANVQPAVIVTGDRLTSQMAWVGHSMFLNDSRLPLLVNFADQCLTPQNGNTPCSAFQSIALIAATPTMLVSDQTAGQLNGDDVYFGGITVSAITGLTQNPFIGLTGGTMQSNFGGTGASFSGIGALALDSSDPANNILYVGDDPTAGTVAGNGRWWQVLSVPPAPAPPSAPLNVTATAGNASATLIWSAPANHQPVTSYTVHDSFASNGVPVPDVTVTAQPGSTIVPAAATVTGLVNGVTYQFEVLASNAKGSGPFSAPSNAVTPQAPTVPGAPTNVSASSGDGSASVSWTAPASDGGSPITSYAVTAFAAGAPTGITVTATGGATGAVLFGLTNGLAYTFSVHATNAVGNGPESVQSAPVTPAAITGPDMSISMTGPASVVAGGNAAYSVVVTNLGPSTASGVTMSDLATGASVSSVTTTQGTCTTVGTSITCNLGSVAAGNSVTITVTLKPTAQVSNQASVQSAGDPNAANNAAGVTTVFIPLNQTTDLQVVGSAQNGGPAVTAPDTFTWQIKNNQSLAANAVHFTSTLAPNMVLQGVSSNVGACSSPAPGTAGATFNCDLATLSGGQAMVVTVNVTFNATGTMSTTGQVTFNGTDNNPANNTASVVVGVR
jgi:uncharacterized repeat protein (TIGR01451 family)